MPLLSCMVFPIFAGSRGGVVNEKSAYDRLLSVEKWQVSLHLVYDHKESDGSSEHVISTWSGTLDLQEIGGLWYNESGLDVMVNGMAEIVSKTCLTTIVANGSAKYGFALKVHKDGYVIGQGYCNTQFGTSTTRCPTGVSTDRGTITYSQPWKIKTPLPEYGKTLSGSAIFTQSSPSLASRPLADGESIKVKWEIAPARERELKYRETALDVAAMNYPGKAVDPHVFEVQAGGGSSWIPHANFAGEVWVDGVNKVKIRTGPGPSPRDAAGRAQNVTSEYMIVREVRSWDMNRMTLDWTPDSPDPIQDWLDNAGVDFAAGPPPTWNKRVMTEFLVQVMGHPEIGRVYAAFAMETRKNAYRIRYAESVFLTEEEYDKIKASPKSNFPYPFTDKGEGWVEIVQDPKTGEWKPLGPVQ